MIGLRVVLLGLVCFVVVLLLVLVPIWWRATFKSDVSRSSGAPGAEPENVIEGEFRHIDLP